MEIKYQNHEQKTKRALATWVKIAEDFNNGVPAAKIAPRYTNPTTGKAYSRSHVYYILRKLREVEGDVQKYIEKRTQTEFA